MENNSDAILRDNLHFALRAPDSDTRPAIRQIQVTKNVMDSSIPEIPAGVFPKKRPLYL